MEKAELRSMILNLSKAKIWAIYSHYDQLDFWEKTPEIQIYIFFSKRPYFTDLPSTKFLNMNLEFLWSIFFKIKTVLDLSLANTQGYSLDFIATFYN